MDARHLLIVLAVALVIFGATALFRRRGVPTPVVLVVAGLVIGFLPFVPDVSLNPDVVLLGLLPLLVYEAAYSASPRAFSRNAVPIALLAVVLVVLTAGAVAAVAHAVAGLSWPMSFVLGTAVGPTDAAAATSIASRIGLPRELVSILEGEALLNDATALVLYGSAVLAATSGSFSALETTGRIGYDAVVGVAIGLAVGVIGRVVQGRLDDPPLEILLSLVIAYVAYLPAQAAGASGVLAAVTAGLYLGWHSSGGASARTRLQSTAFWDSLVFLVNGALFVLVGLSFHTFTAGARGPIGRLVLTAAAVVGVVIALRLAWTFAASWLIPPLRKGAASGTKERLIVGWAGMRGAVSLAAVLAVPTVTRGGEALAGRDDVVYIAFAVIFVTLIGQGLTLPLLVRALGLTEQPSVAETERQARLVLARAALSRIDERCERGDVPEEVSDAMRAQYQARLRHLERLEPGPGDDAAVDFAAERSLRREVVALQREVLLELRAKRRIGSTALRVIERDLDLEDARIR